MRTADGVLPRLHSLCRVVPWIRLCGCQLTGLAAAAASWVVPWTRLCGCQLTGLPAAVAAAVAAAVVAAACRSVRWTGVTVEIQIPRCTAMGNMSSMDDMRWTGVTIEIQTPRCAVMGSLPSVDNALVRLPLALPATQQQHQPAKHSNTRSHKRSNKRSSLVAGPPSTSDLSAQRPAALLYSVLNFRANSGTFRVNSGTSVRRHSTKCTGWRTCTA